MGTWVKAWRRAGSWLFVGGVFAVTTLGCGDLPSESGEATEPDALGETVSALTEPQCSAAHAGLLSSVCTGEWLYKPYALENKQDTSCGQSTTCTTWGTCSVNVSTPVSRPHDIGNFDIAHKEKGDGVWFTVYDPDRPAADRACDAKASALGGTKDGLAAKPRSSSKTRWSWVCTVKVNEDVPTNVSDSRCSCLTYANKSCDVRTGVGSAALSSPGITAAQLENAVGQDDQKRTKLESKTCLSCDDYPLSADGSNASGLFACYESNLTLGSAATRTTLEQRMQLVYELYGTLLSEAQRTRAQDTYRTLAPQFASCSADPAFACAADDNHRSRLHECARLAAPHVSTALTLARFDTCMDALKQVPDVGGCSAREGDVLKARALGQRLVLKAMKHNPPGQDSSAEGLRDGAVRRTYLVGQWWRSAERLALFEPEGFALAESDLDTVLADYWKHASEAGSLDTLRELAKSDSTTDSQLKAALDGVINRGMGNQLVLDALVAAPASVKLALGKSARPVPALIESEALLALFADAVQWNVDRAATLNGAHDLACLFADCATAREATELVQFWWLTSKLGTAEQRGELFTGFRNGSLLAQLAGFRRGAMSGAIERALGSANDFDTGKRRLATLVGRGAAYYQNYLANGQLRGDLSRTLSDTVDHAGAKKLGDDVKKDAETFAAADGTYRQNLKEFVRAITSDVAAGVSVDAAVARRNFHVARHSQLDALIEGLQAAASRADLKFQDLDVELKRIEGVLNQTFVSPVGRGTDVTIKGNNEFDHSGVGGVNLSQLGEMALWSDTIDAGDMVHVSLSKGNDQYSPTCLLRELQVVEETGSTGSGIDALFGAGPRPAPLSASGKETCGPEGFTLVRQGGTTTTAAVSSEHGSSERSYAGVKSEACLKADSPISSASACVYGGYEVSRYSSSSSTHSNGQNSQTTVALSDGLRSARAPFPSAPLGALLLVTVGVADGKVLDIAVAGRTGSSSVVPSAARAYLVVNDLYCKTSESTPGLKVTVQKLRTERGAATAAVRAMAAVQSKLRARATHYVNQGMMLPAERASEQAGAIWELDTQMALAALSAKDMPAALRDLFEAVVTHEMSRIDRVLEISRLERERSLVLEELNALGHEVRAARAVSRLNRLLPYWTLQDLNTERLEAELEVLLATVRARFVPVLKLWYPTFVAELAAEIQERTNPQNAVLKLLGELSPERDLGDVSLSLKKAIVDEVITRFASAERVRIHADRYDYIAVSIPNPNHGDHAGQEGSAFRSAFGYPTIDEASAHEIWQQIAERGAGQVTIRPELVYDVVGGRPGILDCSVSTPIVRKMVLTMVRPGATDIATNSKLRIKTRVTAGRDNWVAQDTGLSRFELADGAWSNMPLLTLDAALAANPANEWETVPNDVLTQVLLRSADEGWAGRDVGISPFGTFTMSFEKWGERTGDWLERCDGQSCTPVASELVLVMVVDSKPTADGKDLSWVTACKKKQAPVP